MGHLDINYLNVETDKRDTDMIMLLAVYFEKHM